MQTYLDCIPCFFSQALRAGRTAGADDETLKELLNQLGEMLREIPMESSPPETGQKIYDLVTQVTGNPDPYAAIKTAATEAALELYEQLKSIVAASDDPLNTAIRIAIAGNIIDLGALETFDPVKSVRTALKHPLAVDDYELFRERLAAAESVLYIGDNAGEAVFDRVLIEELDKPVVFAVRGAPVINDCTVADAMAAGLDRCAQIVSSGTAAPGCIPETCSPAFRKRFKTAEFIIAKGQGNYEALCDCTQPVFFLLMAKCPVIANLLGVSNGDRVLKWNVHHGLDNS